MQWPPAIWVLILIASTVPAGSSARAETELVLVGQEIPQRLYISQRRIFLESDSLSLNGRHLRRNVDYTFDEGRGLFDLSGLEHGPHDTLLVTYEPVPDWVQWSYGRSLPAIVPRTVDRSNPTSRTGGKVAPLRSSDITISGAKSFLFSARSAGASSFSQSLDLQLQGSLAAGVEVRGAVSDRGYAPSYGPSNSRLSELDRISLSLKSRIVAAQVGDMAVVGRFDTTPSPGKRVAGANINLHAPNWYVEALAARPRGRFETYRFLGIDGLQGPYQIGQGRSALPVVPGSEQVWLDGRLLQQGVDKDYAIDYPTGRITFSANHSIDNRSRIEIDYEPRAGDYRGELFSTGGGVGTGDSSLFIAVEFLREGDDKDQPLRGDLSDDERQRLAEAGDSVAAAFRSGATPDSGGNYVLVADSLPDSVYRYVEGDEAEDSVRFTVQFSFVGEGKGDYRFLGGDRYQFVGVGEGDYRPVVFIPAPQRIDYYNARLSLHNRVVGDLTFELRQTLSDRNLFSDRDDDDNRGSLYSLASEKHWLWNGRRNHLSVKARRKEAEFKTRQRLYAADFDREFLLPQGSTLYGDESLYQLNLSLSPSRLVTLSPFFSAVAYRPGFDAATGGSQAQLVPHRRVEASLRFGTTASSDRRSTTERQGTVRVYAGGLSYRLSPQVKLSTSFEHDRRENDYKGELQGTRYNQFRWTFDAQSEKLSYEYYVEDTLTKGWHEILSRNRISTSSDRRFGSLNSHMQVSYQWLARPEARGESFLGRLDLQYHNVRRRLEVRTSYTLSEETRNARGITYLEVERGQGDFLLESGEYVPDPDGNFIRIEEILSERSRISRGEKSFHVSRDFKTVLIRFNSAIREELLDDGKRQPWWAVPFLSDDTQPYLFYSRRYDLDVRMFPLQSAHAVNISLSDDREIRSVAGASVRRRDGTAALTLKQVVKTTFIEESLELFETDRDSYFSGAGRTDGFELGVGVRQAVSRHEVSVGSSYRRAESGRQERSERYAVQMGTRLRVIRRGELRASLELYRQKLTNVTTLPSFRLTGNRPGSRGAVWSAVLRYGLKGELRVNVSVSGRHSDERTARITGRGEMVVGF